MEHRTLPWGRLGLAVYENEYSSIIAYTLASNEYSEFLADARLGQAAQVRNRRNFVMGSWKEFGAQSECEC